MILELLVDLGLHPLVRGLLVVCVSETEPHTLRDVASSEVRGHDDHGVLEVDNPPLGVSQSTIFQNLQQRIEDIRVCLFDLVEQHDGERLAADLLSELTALFVTDVAGRRTEEPRNSVLLAELTHVEADERVFFAEEELSQSLGKLRLTHTGRTGEDERTTWTLRILQARASTTDRLAQRMDCLLLTNNPLVQLGFHPQQTLAFFLRQLEDWDTSRCRENLSDQVLVNLSDDVEVPGLPFLLTLGLLADQVLLVVAQPRGLLEVLSVDRRFLLAADRCDALVELAQIRRSGHAANPQACTSFVDEVNRLVRKEPVIDVAIGQRGRIDKRGVGDRDAVVVFVPIPQPLEDLDRVSKGRLVHLDRLEAALKCSVLLDVFAVLVERRGADRLEFATGQHRLEDARCIDRAFSSTGSDQRVHLVNEHDDVAASADLLEDLLQPLFEVTAVARTSNKRTQVECVELLVLQRLGNFVVDDHLRETFNNGRLSDAGLTDEHRVVLGAARQHLHDALDFLLSTDHGVELGFARGLRQVAAKLVKHQRCRGGALLRPASVRGFLALVARQQLDDGLANTVQVSAKLDEDLRGNTFTFTNQAEQDVLRADVVVTQLQRFTQRELKDLLRAWREWDVTARCLLTLADDLFNLVTNGLERDVHALERLGSNTLALVDEAKQDVLGADVVVVEHARFFLRQHHNPSSPVGKSLEHRHSLS